MDIKNEIRIASIGNVDSAKSTTISVIANNILDDGKGGARSKILKHPHEKDTGRTSSITQYYIETDENILGFIDLAGHEKYLKTTVSGLNGFFIDYAMVTIGLDRGLVGMAREHLALALALKIPIFLVLTKLDIAKEHKRENIKKRLAKLFNHPFAGRKKLEDINHNNIDKLISNYSHNYDKIPLFEISNTRGDNIDNLRKFILSLKYYNKIGDINNSNPKFIIDDRFKIKGIGLVISGITKEGIFNKDETYYFGPFNGKFKRVVIKSIHDNFRNSINSLGCGQSGCFNIKLLDKKDEISFNKIKKGLILIKSPISIKKFRAEVSILHHPTTIKINYQPTIHCGTVRQTAKIYKMSKELIRTGDSAIVDFEFMFKPEYIEIGQKIVFRDGRTKGIGTIKELL